MRKPQDHAGLGRDDSREHQNELVSGCLRGNHHIASDAQLCKSGTSAPASQRQQVAVRERLCMHHRLLPRCLAAWLPGCLAACLLACLPARLAACLPGLAWLPGCLLSSLPPSLPSLPSLPVCLPGCLPACLPTCLHASLPARLASRLVGWQAGQSTGRPG